MTRTVHFRLSLIKFSRYLSVTMNYANSKLNGTGTYMSIEARHRKIDGYDVIKQIGRHNMVNLSNRRYMYTGGGNMQ